MDSVAAGWSRLGCLSNQHAPAKPLRGLNPECDIVKVVSTLAVSGGVAGGVHQEAEEVGWRIGHRWGAGRGWRILVGVGGPEVSAGGGERVAEGGLRLGVPGGLARREAVGMRGVGHEDDHAEEAEEAGGS